MRGIGRYFVTGLLAVSLFTTGCVAQNSTTTSKGMGAPAQPQAQIQLPQSKFRTLSELTDAFAVELAATTEDRSIYLNKAQIRDTNTGDVARFSASLQNELESSLSGAGFEMQYLAEDADILLGAEFQQYGSNVKIFFKYHTQDLSINKTIDYHIERAKLPQKAFEENLRSKARQVAAKIIEDDTERTIFVKPFEDSSCKCVTDFSRIFANLVKNELVQLHSNITIVDGKPAKQQLNDKQRVQEKAQNVKNLETANAYLVGADTVLKGSYFKNGELVMLSLFLVDLEGNAISSTAVDINSSIIKIPISEKIIETKDEEAAKLSEMAGRKDEKKQNVVKITSNGLGDYPTFRDGELITFYIKAKKPLYVHIYDIDSKGKVTRLYPYSTGSQNKVRPGKVVMIPSESDKFEFKVSAPYGKDAVKLFASSYPMPIPTKTRGLQVVEVGSVNPSTVSGNVSAIKPKDLVPYYRDLAEEQGFVLYEDSLVFETKAK